MTGPDRIWATEDKENFGEDRFHSTFPMKGLTEYVRADLYAALEAEIARLTAERDAALAKAVKVKPLVWVDFHDRGAKAHAWNEANYMIQKWSDGRWEISASYPGYSTSIYGTDRFYPTIEAAKAAAQADYEARILDAIQPDPEARQAALAAAVIAALHDIDDLVANSKGVSGLHLNGDMAPWSELMDGGAYGAWLQSVERLREAIRALTPPADLAAKIGGE